MAPVHPINMLYYIISNCLLIPYIREQKIIKISRIKIILTSTFICGNSVAFYLHVSKHIIAGMTLVELSMLSEILYVVVAIIVFFLTQLINYNIFNQIAKGFLLLRCSLEQLKIHESILIVGHCLLSIVSIIVIYVHVCKLTCFDAADKIVHIFKILVDLYNYFCIRIFLIHVWILQGSFRDINARITRILQERYIVNKRSESEVISLKLTKIKIKELADIHNVSCNISRMINCAHAPCTLVIVAYVFIVLTYIFFYVTCIAMYYNLIKDFEEFNVTNASLATALSFAFNVSLLMEIGCLCRNTSNEVRIYIIHFLLGNTYLHIASCAICLGSMVFYIKGGMHTKGI